MKLLIKMLSIAAIIALVTTNSATANNYLCAKRADLAGKGITHEVYNDTNGAGNLKIALSRQASAKTDVSTNRGHGMPYAFSIDSTDEAGVKNFCKALGAHTYKLVRAKGGFGIHAVN